MNLKEYYKERLLNEQNNMNINELKAFTDKQLNNPVTNILSQDQLGRLRTIAANHNANPNRTSMNAQRIAAMIRARGSMADHGEMGVKMDATERSGTTVLRTNYSNDIKPIHNHTTFNSREYGELNRYYDGEIVGKTLRDRARKDRAKSAAADAGRKEANKRGFKTPEGITEKNNMNIKEYYKQILNSEINEKLIGKQHKIDADGNKVINRKDFAIINAKKKSAMNAVDEGYARSNRINDSMRRKVERGIAVPAGLRRR